MLPPRETFFASFLSYSQQMALVIICLDLILQVQESTCYLALTTETVQSLRTSGANSSMLHCKYTPSSVAIEDKVTAKLLFVSVCGLCMVIVCALRRSVRCLCVIFFLFS